MSEKIRRKTRMSTVRNDHHFEHLVESRKLMSLIHNIPSFERLVQLCYIDGCPKEGKGRNLPWSVLYKGIKKGGMRRAIQVADFIVSILEDNPSHFWFCKTLNRVDASYQGIRTRAGKLARHLLLNPEKPIIEKFARDRYHRYWKNGIYLPAEREGGEAIAE
jgi:hypothetical protein